jgi:hypothetical protein
VGVNDYVDQAEDEAEHGLEQGGELGYSQEGEGAIYHQHWGWLYSPTLGIFFDLLPCFLRKKWWDSLKEPHKGILRSLLALLFLPT